MPLNERILADVNRVFLNAEHFAETHYWNGLEILCVTDEEEAIKRKNNNVNDISWDNNVRKILLHVSEADFPEGEKAEPNTTVMLDRRPMRVLDVSYNMGLIDILLEEKDPRELV